MKHQSGKQENRRKALHRALSGLIPRATLEDFAIALEIAERGHLRHLPAGLAAWQAVTTLARHIHTDYDSLLDEGYDRESARHFVQEAMNDKLADWGCPRRLGEDADFGQC